MSEEQQARAAVHCIAKGCLQAIAQGLKTKLDKGGFDQPRATDLRTLLEILEATEPHELAAQVEGHRWGEPLPPGASAKKQMQHQLGVLSHLQDWYLRYHEARLRAGRPVDAEAFVATIRQLAKDVRTLLQDTTPARK